MRRDLATKEYEKKLKYFLTQKDKAVKKLEAKFATYQTEWLKRVNPFKVSDVLEVVKGKTKYKRFVIYQFAIQRLDKTPIVSAWGWWLDKDNNPIKWDNYPFYNCVTDYTMELSPDQTHNPVKGSNLKTGNYEH